MPDLRAEASVCPSGQGILFVFRDAAAGALAPVVSLSDQREVQSLVLAAGASTTPSTLSLGGLTTAPIPRAYTPPPVYFLWAITPPGPGPTELAVSMPAYSANRSATVTYEVFDGDPAVVGTLLGVVAISHAGPDGTATFTEGTRRDGTTPLVYARLGTFTFSGSATARVRVSCAGTAGANEIYCDQLRLRNVATGSIARVGPDAPPAASIGPSGNLQQYPTYLDAAGSPGANHNFGAGAGGYATFDPAVVQSALRGLAGHSSDFTCSGTGTAADPLIVRFVGGFGQAGQPLLTSSDPAVVVSRTSAGDCWPKVTVDGGSPIPLANPYYGTGLGDPAVPTKRTQYPYLPFVYFPFLQSPPTTREKIGAHLSSIANTGPGWIGSTLAGYADRPQASHGVGASATWRRDGLPACTIRLAFTWAADPGNSTDVVFTVKNRAGATLAAYHVDQTSAPSGAADDGVPWQVGGSHILAGFVDDLIVTLTNNSSGTMIADAVRFERTSPDTSYRINPGSVVAYSAGFGWAAGGVGAPGDDGAGGLLAAVTGRAPAVSGAPVANNSGVYRVAEPLGRALEVGYNVNQAYSYQGVRQYANAMAGYQEPGYVLDRDADGYPTHFSGVPQADVGVLAVQVLTPPASYQGDGRGWPNCSAGPWTILWDGTADMGLGGVERAGEASFSGAAGHRRVFDVAAPAGSYAPVVTVKWFSSSKDPDNTFRTDARNIRVYQGDLAADPASIFTAGFAAKVAAAGSLRWLDPLQGIQGCCRDIGDYTVPRSNIAKYGSARIPTADVVRVEPDSGYWIPSGGVVFRVTTAAPHGFGEDDFVVFGGTNYNATLSDSSTYPLNTYGTVHILNATQFTYQQGPGGGLTMAGPVSTPGMTVLARCGTRMPLADIVAACNLGRQGSGADLHFNIGYTATTDCAAAVGAYAAARLEPGARLRMEFGNEPWNDQFSGYKVLTTRTHAAGLGDGWIPYYLTRADQLWAAAEAAMAAAGRPGGLVRVVNSKFDDPGVTAGLASYAQAHGIAVHDFAIAPYIGNAPAPPRPSGQEIGLADLVDVLSQADAGQDLDLLYAHRLYGGYEAINPAHRAAMAAHGFAAARLSAYEGGPSGTIPYPSTAYAPPTYRVPSRAGYRSNAVHRHPGHYHLLQLVYRQEQDSGMDGPYHNFELSGGGDNVIGGTLAEWSAAIGTDQPPGTGDPTLDAANLATPDRLDLVKSEVVGAVDGWMASLGASVAPLPPAIIRRVWRGRSYSRRR